MCAISKKILIKYKNSKNILAIRQLYLMRPHPVLMQEYYPDEEKFDKMVDNKNFFYRIIGLIKDYYSEIQKYYTYNLSKNDFQKKKNSLFLTHLINEKHLRVKEDFYFGKLPKFLQKNNFSTINILRNLTNKNSSIIYKNNKKYLKDKILLSKSLNFFDEIKLILNVLILYIELVKLKNIDKNVKYFLSNKKIFKFAGSSYNNLKLLIQIENIIKTYNPKYFFLTYEGHAWEKLIISQIKKKFPNLKIFAYQFSILTRYSSSIYLNIGNMFNPDFILTSGNYSKKLFLKNYKSKIKCINIGSNKFVHKKKLIKNSDCVLILPEGFNSETIKMIEFTIKAANKFKQMKFIFRFHPMVNKKLFLKEYIKNKLIIPKNLIISKNSFDKDLEKSKYVIYRGSAAAIQALSLNKIIIYLNFINELNIDPLYMLKNKFYVQKIDDLKKIFFNKKIMMRNQINTAFTKQYFDKPNYFSLLNYLN